MSADRHDRPADGGIPPDPAAAAAVLTVLTAEAARHTNRKIGLARYERWCAGQAPPADPWPVAPATLLAFVAGSGHLTAKVLRQTLRTVCSQHVDTTGTDPKWMWLQARDLVRAMKRSGLCAGPMPRSRRLSRDELLALAKAKLPSPARRALLARDRAALHLLAEGIPVEVSARARPDRAVVRADGLVLLDLPHRRAQRPRPAWPAGTVALGPAASAAIVELLAVLPESATGLLDLAKAGHNSADRPDTAVGAPHTPKDTASRANGALAAAAGRAGIAWRPGSGIPTARDLEAVSEHLDPYVRQRLQSQVFRTVRAQTALRAIELLRVPVHHVRRTDDGNAYELTVVILKHREEPVIETVTVRRDPEPLLDPVSALDDLLAHHTRYGHTDGPLLPAADGRVRETGDVRSELKTEAERARVDTAGFGTRSFRVTAATATVETGGTVEDAQQLLGHAKRTTTALYLRDTEPWELDL